MPSVFVKDDNVATDISYAMRLEDCYNQSSFRLNSFYIRLQTGVSCFRDVSHRSTITSALKLQFSSFIENSQIAGSDKKIKLSFVKNQSETILENLIEC